MCGLRTTRPRRRRSKSPTTNQSVPGVGDLAEHLKALPAGGASPTLEAGLKLASMLGSFVTTAEPLLSVCVAACDSVGSHCFVWLGVEMRRDSQRDGGLGSGNLSDGWPDHPVVNWTGPYFKPYQGDNAPVQTAKDAKSAAGAATAVVGFLMLKQQKTTLRAGLNAK